MTNREAVENNHVLLFEAKDVNEPAWEVIIDVLKKNIKGFSVGYGKGNWMAFAIPKNQMPSMVKQIVEDLCALYEQGKMMRDDSEVEIDLFEDGYWLCDYSKSRGSAEPIAKLCDTDDITKDEIIEICDKNGWINVLM